jgi:sRNA-binding carbon storage regulator CsrA
MLVLSRRIGEAIVIGDTLVEVMAVDSLTAKLKIVTDVNGESRERNKSLKINESTLIEEGQARVVLIEIREIDSLVFKIRLGIECPSEMAVHRKEVLDAIQREVSKEQNVSETQYEVDRQIAQSDPSALIAVDFGPGFSEDEIQACLSYLSEVYRLRGGVGLKVVSNLTMVPEDSEVPYVS